MGDVTRISIQSSEAAPEDTLDALREAADKAPTTTAEAEAAIKAAQEAEKAKTEDHVERPEGLPEKFNSWEDMAKAYSELEKKLGAPKPEEAPKEEEKPEEVEKKEGEEKNEEAPKASDVVSKLSQNFETNGKLSDEDYALAESIGLDRATVDGYAAGQKALAELATARITEAAGGKDSMERMFAWASTSLKAEEIDTFNASFGNSDVEAAVIAMESLKTKYEAANGREPKLIGGKPPSASLDVFESWAQVTQAMSDPRYKTDPAYAAAVSAKLGRSNPRSA